jgi:hypothetical protein
VIRTGILIASPIFLSGLIETLNSAGIKIVAARTSRVIQGAETLRIGD